MNVRATSISRSTSFSEGLEVYRFRLPRWRRRRTWKQTLRVTCVVLFAGILSVGIANPTLAATGSVSISVLPTQLIAPGGTAKYPFVVQSRGSVGAMSISVSGEPAGASTEITSGGNGVYELSVIIPTSAPPSLSTIVIRTRSRAATKSASVYLEVRGASVKPLVVSVAPVVATPPIATPNPTNLVTPPALPVDFALEVPPSVNLAVGGKDSILIGFRIVGSTAPTVALGVSGLPSGVSVTFVPNPTFGNSTLDFTAANNASPGVYAIGIVGFSGGVNHTYPMTLNLTGGIAGGFGLTISPLSLSAKGGSTVSFSVAVVPNGGFASEISWTVSGLPSGPTASISGTSPNHVVPIAVPENTIPGTYVLVLTGISGSLIASVSVTLTIT
jgi:hypothetical protein